MAEEDKNEWEAYWAGEEQSANDGAGIEADAGGGDTMLTADTMVETETHVSADVDVGDTLSSLSNMPKEKKKKPIKISKFFAWKAGIKNILFEQTEDAQMITLKNTHKRLTLTFRILAWVSLVVLIVALWSVMPEVMSIVIFLILTVATIGIIFAVGGTDAIMNLSHVGDILGRYAMLYLILAALVLIAATVVVGINLYKNEAEIYDRYDRIIVKNKTRAYHKEAVR